MNKEMILKDNSINNLEEKIGKIKDKAVNERINELVINYINHMVEMKNKQLLERIQKRINQRLQLLQENDEDKIEALCKIYFYLYSGRKTLSGLSRFFLINKDLSKEELLEKYNKARRW